LGVLQGGEHIKVIVKPFLIDPTTKTADITVSVVDYDEKPLSNIFPNNGVIAPLSISTEQTLEATLDNSIITQEYFIRLITNFDRFNLFKLTVEVNGVKIINNNIVTALPYITRLIFISEKATVTFNT
jgi:hypothetical protein